MNNSNKFNFTPRAELVLVLVLLSNWFVIGYFWNMNFLLSLPLVVVLGGVAFFILNQAIRRGYSSFLAMQFVSLVLSVPFAKIFWTNSSTLSSHMENELAFWIVFYAHSSAVLTWFLGVFGNYVEFPNVKSKPVFAIFIALLISGFLIFWIARHRSELAAI